LDRVQGKEYVFSFRIATTLLCRGRGLHGGTTNESAQDCGIVKPKDPEAPNEKLLGLGLLSREPSLVTASFLKRMRAQTRNLEQALVSAKR
jgi:hypothetical protein